MICAANDALAQYNSVGAWLTGLALVLCTFGIGGTVQSFTPVHNWRRKMLWVWIGFFSGAGVIGITVMYKQIFHRVADLVDIYRVQQATTECMLLHDTRIFFSGLAATSGLNLLLLTAGGMFFLLNLIGLLAYMWIPPLVRREESKR
jgi:hypothetical protein